MTDTVRTTSELISLLQPIPTSPAKSTNRQLVRDIVKSFDIVRQISTSVKDAPYFMGTGSADDSSNLQSLLNAGAPAVIIPPNTTVNLANGVTFATAGQRIFGMGDTSIINYTGAGTVFNVNGKDHCAIKDLQIKTLTGAIAVDLPILSHSWVVSGCHISGFSTAAIRGVSSYYGSVILCDIENNGTGILGLSDFNGNTVALCGIRQNLIGVDFQDAPIGSAGNRVALNTIESARASSLYGVRVLGSNSNIIGLNRFEYTVGVAHCLVDFGAHNANYNQLDDNVYEGTIASILLGDGSGVDQVIGTHISGGRGALVTVNADVTDTELDLPVGAWPTNPTDNGSRTSLTREGNLSYASGITGGTTSPTAVFKYARRGDTAILWIQQLTVTSNTTACTLTGLPALITPKANAQTLLAPIFDNGVLAVGAAKINTDGTITLSKGIGGAGGDFTAAGSKGISPIVLTYKIN